jgi:multidrug transporter EmrE-like cation transporter
LAGLFFVNLSLIFISMSFKTINITIANASFAGLTVLLVTMIGYFCFNERYTLFQYFCIATIIFGVVALNLTGVGK